MFSIVTVDLLNPIRPIEQGSFNTRPLSQNAIAQLVKNMKMQGVRRHLYSTAIPILAKRHYIDQSSIFKDVTKIQSAPALKLTPEGEKKVKMFYAAGGNHRTEAVKVLAGEEKENIQKLKVAIKKIENKGEKTKSVQVKLEQLHQQLEESERKLAGMGLWTVLLYDEGE